jgi:hypothetical protein
MQAHDGGGVVVDQPRLGWLPDVKVQPGQPQPDSGGENPGVAEHAPPLDPTGLLPATESSAEISGDSLSGDSAGIEGLHSQLTKRSQGRLQRENAPRGQLQ